MIQGKDKRSWNKEIPFSIVSTIISQWRLQKRIRRETNTKGVRDRSKNEMPKYFLLGYLKVIQLEL